MDASHASRPMHLFVCPILPLLAIISRGRRSNRVQYVEDEIMELYMHQNKKSIILLQE
jgi:hypothetical protein